MRLVKQKSNGIIYVALNRREMAIKEQIADMLWCYDMKWNVSKQNFIGEPPFGYIQMKRDVMHDIREYRKFLDVLDFGCMKSNLFNYEVTFIKEGYYLLRVSDGCDTYYAGTYNTDWFEQYFIDNTNILEKRREDNENI